MLRRSIVAGALVMTAAVLLPGVAAAQQQSVALNIGVLTLRGEDTRPVGDVLLENLYYHAFDLRDLDGATISGEWMTSLGRHIEASVGVGFYQRRTPAVYIDWVNEDGSDIMQDFKLQMVPVTAIVRFLPTGRRAPVQPYIGAGVAVIRWRYSETGEFIDSNGDVFRGNFVGRGTDVGPVIVGGVRVPVSLGFSLGGEVRYQQAEGRLNANDFNGDRIDLGAFTYQLTMQFKF